VPMDRQRLVFEIDKLPEAGMKLERVIEGELFDIEGEDVSLNESVKLKGELKKVRRDVLFSASIETVATVCCSRCLQATPQSVRCMVKAQFKPKAEDIQSDSEIELSSEDCEIEYFEGDVISLVDVVRDGILLSFPAMVLCQENCQGLCPQCGANLNLNSCSCGMDAVVDPRFEKLKQLKEKLK